MFTGLVEGLGIIRELIPEQTAMRLRVELPASLSEGTQNGDSIAINGCCLTVVAFEGNLLDFQAGSETLSRTNLGQLKPGDQVNLERALAAGARLGGHFVQGHVDATGKVVAIDQEGEWTFMRFSISAELDPQMVSKGSITVDGISLTLVDVNPGEFSVALIPHTLEVTTLGERQVGDTVNIETDIIGKYIQKLMQGERPPLGETFNA
ncbi:MAG: riboflavin synthase [Planctomycetaceae bacterium]|nr:riboflavin synthase [Planctomycetaceae bacterium]